MHLIILILGLLLLPHASALKCYACDHDNPDCTKIQVCGMDPDGRTKRDRCGATTLLSVPLKGCSTAAECMLAATVSKVSGEKTSCCASNLCNGDSIISKIFSIFSGASISTVSLVVLAAPLVCVALFN